MHLLLQPLQRLGIILAFGCLLPSAEFLPLKTARGLQCAEEELRASFEFVAEASCFDTVEVVGGVFARKFGVFAFRHGFGRVELSDQHRAVFVV